MCAMKRLNVLGALLAALLISTLVGCGGGASSKYVGSWDTNMNGQSAVTTFNGDGTFAMDMDIPMLQGAKAAVKGTYKEEGENLTVAFTDVEVSNLPEQFKGKEAEMQAGIKEQMAKDGSETAPVKWEGNDKFTINGKNGAVTFTRKA